LTEIDAKIASKDVKPLTNIKSEFSRYFGEANSQSKGQRLIFVTISNVSRDVLPEIL